VTRERIIAMSMDSCGNIFVATEAAVYRLVNFCLVKVVDAPPIKPFITESENDEAETKVM